MKRNAFAILEELRHYNAGELFYKRCYELRNDRAALRAYIMSIDPDESEFQDIVIPRGVFPHKVPSMGLPLPANGQPFKMTEDFIFSNRFLNRDIILKKHDRYCPAFVHFHEFFEVFYCLSGGCVSTIDGKRISFSEGNLCFILPHTNHMTEIFSDSIVINLLIRKSTFDEFCFNLLTGNNLLSRFFMGGLFFSKAGKYVIFDTSEDTEFPDMILDMFAEQAVDDAYSNSIMRNRIEIFFSLLMRRYGNRPVTQKDEQRAIKNKHMDMIAYINENFRTVTLAQLARHFNLERAYCSRLIKAITGKTFTALICGIRMRFAKQLLQDSNERIYDISYSLGFENQETFIRTFKKTFAQSPAEYRRRYRQNGNQ
jgi:AraC-like DNA-binding protein/mannose-6-phosphate isomerase-like protein (cupin superfamily)